MTGGYLVTCPRCGHQWRSFSVSGKTRCGECRTRVYVPVERRPVHYVEAARQRRARNEGRATAVVTQARDAGPSWGNESGEDEWVDGERREDDYDDEDRRNARRGELGSLPTPSTSIAAALRALVQPSSPWRGTRGLAAPSALPAGAKLASTGGQLASGSSTSRSSATPACHRIALVCGHDVLLGGKPAAWYGVAVPCPRCGRDVNVDTDRLRAR